ncbi:MAG: histidinol-phosphatase HisJ family protein [Bacillota bacterium]
MCPGSGSIIKATLHAGYWIDYHVHPGYSIDAEDTSIFEYCREALRKGLREVCFTPHLEVDPRRRHLDWFVRVNGKIVPMENDRWLDCYFRDLEKARAEFSGAGLVVKAGLEVGFERGSEAAIAKVVGSRPFDFVLGSIHCLEHHAISSLKECRAYFARKDLSSLAEDYFGALQEAVESGLFDCIGHLDLYKRYGYEFFGPAINDLHRGRVEGIFRAMAGRGTGLEVNTSSRRRGLAEFHPGRDILVLAKEAGMQIFTVGSDAHKKTDLGYCTGEAAQLLNEMGLRVSVFTSRRATIL